MFLSFSMHNYYRPFSYPLRFLIFFCIYQIILGNGRAKWWTKIPVSQTLGRSIGRVGQLHRDRRSPTPETAVPAGPPGG